VHAQHIIDQQLKETKTITPNDTVIFGPMSPEKPNAGKLVQLYEGFPIKKFQSTIWVPNLAYQIQNFLTSSTSQSETNVLAEILDKTSGKSSAPICHRIPNVYVSGLYQPLFSQRWPYVSLLAFRVSNAGLSEAMCSS